MPGGYTQPVPSTWPRAPFLAGRMRENEGQSVAVCAVGPWPLIKAISLASGAPATA